MTRAVREAVGFVASSDVEERIIRGALEIASLQAIPEDVEQARSFIDGPLQMVLIEVLGLQSADAVMRNLDPVVEMATSHVRAATPKTRPTARAPSGEEAIPLVLVATRDKSGIQRIARRLIGRADVKPANDVFELVYALEVNVARPCLVIIDCCLPAVDARTVANMLAGFSSSLKVVLWGASATLTDQVRAASKHAQGWHTLSAEATDKEVATVLDALL